MHNLGRLFSYVRPHRVWLVTGGALMILVGLLEGATALLVGPLLPLVLEATAARPPPGRCSPRAGFPEPPLLPPGHLPAAGGHRRFASGRRDRPGLRRQGGERVPGGGQRAPAGPGGGDWPAQRPVC